MHYRIETAVSARLAHFWLIPLLPYHAFVQKAVAALTNDNLTVEENIALVMETGKFGVDVMEEYFNEEWGKDIDEP